MFLCHVCHTSEYKEEHTHQVFEIDGKPVLVENVPVKVCMRCGENSFDIETAEKIRLMTHQNKKPLKTISVPVFEFEEE